MSVQERLAAILPQASAEFSNKNYVAILGLSRVGKTVLVTLLSHALDNHFFGNPGGITGHITKGRQLVETWENGMSDGEFPLRTQPLARDDIVIEMSGRGATGATTEIKLPDISGETFSNLCLGEEVSGPERVLQVLEIAKPKGKTFGEMGYVIYADMYLILLDCSKMEEWEKLAIRHAQALTTIRDFKEVIKKTKKGKVENPIGIILTKSDTLPNPDESAEQIIRNKMKRFLNALDSVHSGKKEFFKFHVDVERNQDNVVNDPNSLKVRKPLTYSHDECVRLITWMHDNI